ncbi:MAG: amidohydrolase [Alphaproteobacteria bacterium]|nr:amidohydrolase [Alphaproteobacteria bacterium]
MTTALAKLKETNAEASQWRRHIHAHPETAFEECRTSDYVARLLTSWGVEIHRGMAKTAVVGIIKGKSNKSGRAIGLRADMDALNILEETNVQHCSKHEGKMHACGHDGHTAMLLAATKYLAETRNFDGTVYAIFQPAEEHGGGGDVMVQEGFFKKFPCEAVFGMHNWPWAPAGTMMVREGAVSASADEFVIRITGRGGHAAFPHTVIDPVAAASQIVTALQSIVSRNTDPLDSAVISVCKFQAGTESLNVVPETAILGGTARALKPETRKRLEQDVRRIVKSVAEAYGATAEVEWDWGYPSVINTPKEAKLCWEVAEQVVGKGNVSEFTPMMGAEDFAYFLQACPGAYVIIGGGKSGNDPGLHNPHFDFNDDVIPVGAAYWVKLAETALPPAK